MSEFVIVKVTSKKDFYLNKYCLVRPPVMNPTPFISVSGRQFTSGRLIQIRRTI